MAGQWLSAGRKEALSPKEETAMAMAVPEAEELQAALLDFALAELIRQHRCSFMPLWSRDSWAKFLIWLALNCGCSRDRQALEAFASSLGPSLSGRLRRLFFERELENLQLRVLADPAEAQVLLLPLGPARCPELEAVAAALEALGLTALVLEDRSRWQIHEALVAVPWRAPAL